MATKPIEAEPWERQKGERDSAWKAFQLYRDMLETDGKRSIRVVAQRMNVSTTAIAKQSKRWNWQERVRAYDNELDRRARDKAVKERKSMISRHIGISMQLQKKALSALDSLSVEDLSPKEVREWIKLSTELERLNRMLQAEQLEDPATKATSLSDAIEAAWKKRRGGQEE